MRTIEEIRQLLLELFVIPQFIFLCGSLQVRTCP